MAYTTIDNPELYFQTKLYSGSSSDVTVTFDGSEDMQPDWVWLKKRSGSGDSLAYDSVRGTNKRLQPNAGDAEVDRSGNNDELKSFNSDGWTLGTFNSNVTGAGSTNVSWNWKAGTSFSNSGGSNGADLASSGSYNRDAGFSIVTFTGNATADQQIYHGLNSVPKWMLLKNRTNSNNESWAVYHASMGNTYRLNLNTNGAKSNSDSAEFWANTTPTSTVLSIGRQDQVNGSGNTHVVYCFSEIQGYSKFGSYTGNANTNGTMIYTGFRPSFVLIKNTSASEHWRIYDNKRDTYNHMYHVIYANESSAESTVNNASEEIDFLSNGIKIRSSAAQLNGSGNELIYMAFAESPLVNSNSVPANAR